MITRCVVAAFVVVAYASFANAQSGRNVLLVVNDATRTGGVVAQHYLERRAVPSANVCHVVTTAEETITRPAYDQQIELPVWRCMASNASQDRIVYIVLTKGMPLRIQGTTGRLGTVASVDSELTLLYRRRAGEAAGLSGRIPNPYFAAATPPSDLQSFTHEHHDTYLVTRLDGYTLDDALALIDRGASATRDGRFVFDARASAPEIGDTWLKTAGERLAGVLPADRVLLDQSRTVVTNESRVLGYYSWGSNDPAIRIRNFQLGFVPGALAGMFVSTDARTFREPPPSWLPGDAAERSRQFEGSAQSLVADLVRQGVTGAAGHVAEPFLDATIRPDILFPAYVRGMNLAEAYYLAMPYLSWQTIVLGDPLCAPFREHVLTDAELDGGLDQATELPVWFASRRLAAFPKTAKGDATKLLIKAEARLARSDAAGAQQALEAAVAADPQFTLSRFTLAERYEQVDRVADAVLQYRAVLAYAPNNPIALNNLAYALAVRENRPAEALPVAQRAAAVAPGDANVLDTLAWTQHLVGRDADAARTIGLARTAGSANSDIRWHAAVIFAANNNRAGALSELAALIALEPSRAERVEVKDLRQQLNAPP